MLLPPDILNVAVTLARLPSATATSSNVGLNLNPRREQKTTARLHFLAGPRKAKLDEEELEYMRKKRKAGDSTQRSLGLSGLYKGVGRRTRSIHS